MADARYTYLPWVRHGIATLIPVADPLDETIPARARLPVRLRLDLEERTSSSATITARLQGPSDITGIDPGQIVRTVPEADASDVEGNYFAHVEFARVDLPWLATPAAPGQDKLRPWIVLLVVQERAGVRIAAGAPGMSAVLSLSDVTGELPPLAESWAWAHVQVTGRLASTSELSTLIQTEPHRVVSRLMSPRHLADNTPYLACVVPAFEVGRKAGLRLPITPEELDELAPAWTADHQGGLSLPVYHSWRFRTGPDGDFEALARRLQPFPMPPTVGVREIDVAHAGSGLPASSTGDPVLLGVGGALRSPAAERPGWDRIHRRDMHAALTDILERAAVTQDDGVDDPIVGPPFYGRWHAATETIPAPSSPIAWVRRLNLNPGYRTTAALGAQIVRKHQEHYMERAWQQVGDVVEANRSLRQAQLARETSGSARRRHFDGMASDDKRVQLASPALSRVRVGNGTARGELRESSVPNGAVSGAFRRITRPSGGPSRHSGTANQDWAGRTLTRLADPHDPLTIGDELFPPDGMATVEHLTQQPATLLIAGYDQFDANRRVPARPDANMEAVRSQVSASLDPAVAVTERVRTRIALPAEQWSRSDPLAPVLAAPEFPEPMYEHVPVDWLVPGLGVMPDDAVGILEVNSAFVEAFMTGLNHEFARELLWREYPTDQRGTSFRQFWDVRGTGAHIPNIEAIHTWRSGPLGAHMTIAGSPAEGVLVVMVKGAIFRRYPGVSIYLAKATWSHAQRVPKLVGGSEVHKFPVFSGKVGKDARFFGFQVSMRNARGAALPEDPRETAGLAAGWFFVLEEPPSQPRFGLDDGPAIAFSQLTTWSDLGWESLGVPEGGFVNLAAVAGTEPGPLDGGIAWGQSAAHMARITLEIPARVLFHASGLLPLG
jgi:hypothetical protein